MIVVVPLLAVSMSTTTPVAVTSLPSVASLSAASSTACAAGSGPGGDRLERVAIFETQLERAVSSTDAPLDDDVGAAGDREVLASTIEADEDAGRAVLDRERAVIDDPPRLDRHDAAHANP